MVKESDFKTCAQSGFCARQRAYASFVDLEKATREYSLLWNSLQVQSDQGKLSIELLESVSATKYSLLTSTFAHSCRLSITQLDPVHSVYTKAGDFTLENLPAPAPFTLSRNGSASLSLSFGVDQSILIVNSPFRLEYAVAGTPVVVFNDRGYFNYEHARSKAPEVLENQAQADPSLPDPSTPAGTATLSPEQEARQSLLNAMEQDLWEESFGGKTDSKPRGARFSNLIPQDLLPLVSTFLFLDQTTFMDCQNTLLISL